MRLGINASQSTPSTTFSVGGNREVARIGSDGIMRFTVEANDENAAKFVECIELVIGRRLSGVYVSKASATLSEPTEVQNGQ